MDQRPEQTPHQRRQTDGKQASAKMLHFLCHQGTMRQQCDTTAHLLEWPKSRNWRHQTLARAWGNRNSHSLLVRMQSGAATLEDGWAVSYRTNHPLIIWASSWAPWYLLKGVENLCPHTNLHMGVYSSFIHNCWNLEATKMPFSRWRDE